MPRIYELPTHLQVEDVLIAGLTARQLVRLMIGAIAELRRVGPGCVAAARRCVSVLAVAHCCRRPAVRAPPAGRPPAGPVAARRRAVCRAAIVGWYWRPGTAQLRQRSAASSRAGPSSRCTRTGSRPVSTRPTLSLQSERPVLWWRRRSMSAVALQARLDLAALEGGVACFGTRSPTHAVTLLDVVGAEAALASADDATQEEMLAGRAQFLNAQTTPFQVLVRAEPVDLEGHLRRVQARAEQLPGGTASDRRSTTSAFCRRWRTSGPCSSATATWCCPTSAPRFQPFRLASAARLWPASSGSRSRCASAPTIPRWSRRRSRAAAGAERPGRRQLGRLRAAHAPPGQPADRRAAAPLLVARAGAGPAAARGARRLHDAWSSALAGWPVRDQPTRRQSAARLPQTTRALTRRGALVCARHAHPGRSDRPQRLRDPRRSSSARRPVRARAGGDRLSAAGHAGLAEPAGRDGPADRGEPARPTARLGRHGAHPRRADRPTAVVAPGGPARRARRRPRARDRARGCRAAA